MRAAGGGGRRAAAIMPSTMHHCAGASPRPRSWRPAVAIPSSRMRAARISYGTEVGAARQDVQWMRGRSLPYVSRYRRIVKPTMPNHGISSKNRRSSSATVFESAVPPQ